MSRYLPGSVLGQAYYPDTLHEGTLLSITVLIDASSACSKAIVCCGWRDLA